MHPKWLSASLIALTLIAPPGCAPPGTRSIVLESAAPDGIWAIGGWLIRRYEPLEMRQAYDAAAKVAREQGWKPGDRKYSPYAATLEYKAEDGSEVVVRIWAPAAGPFEVGIQFDRGDGRLISADYLDRFAELTGAKRLP